MNVREIQDPKLGAAVHVRVETERGGATLTKSEAIELQERLKDLIDTWAWV